MAVLVVLIMYWVICASCTATQYGMIEGTTRGVKGWGTYILPFVTVSADGHQDISDLYGHYSIHNLPLGSYEVKASAPGYKSVTYTVELTEGSPFVTLDFILESDGDGGGSDKYCIEEIYFLMDGVSYKDMIYLGFKSS